jgi:AbrB family looped-hinge helix DNA binding protein
MLEQSMAKPSSLKTKVSTKGQVILPKAIRDRRGWTAGAELLVEDRPEGVL